MLFPDGGSCTLKLELSKLDSISLECSSGTAGRPGTGVVERSKLLSTIVPTVTEYGNDNLDFISENAPGILAWSRGGGLA